MYLNSLCKSNEIENKKNPVLSYYYGRKLRPSVPEKTEVARDYKDYSDIELIDLFVKNEDELAYNEIYRRYYKIVLGLILKSSNDIHRAEDLTQQVFIKLFTSASKFRKQAKFSTWLYAITQNTLRMSYRTLKNKKITLSVDDEKYNSSVESDISERNNTTINNQENIVITREIVEKLNEALGQVPKKSREVYLLREQNGYTNPEIAEELGISINSVKARLFRTRVQIKEKLDNLNPY